MVWCANKDCINAAVCLTRGYKNGQTPNGSNYGGGLFNIVTDSGWLGNTTPSDTEWAVGETGNLASSNYSGIL